MSEPSAAIYVDLAGEMHLTGFLWIADARGKTTATFRYAESWLEHPSRFAVDPLLGITSAGPFHKSRLFGALADSAPDRWGRTLMARAERLRAREEGRAQRSLRDIDYVLGVSDLARQGALRFALDEGGEFVVPPDAAAIPPLVELPTLLAAAQGFLDNPDSVDALRVLLAPGSSLGGARPKASVRGSDGRLTIAKFPRDSDGYSVCAWEYVALELAGAAGIDTADAELYTVDDREVLLLSRFDRAGNQRIPFVSAMTLLDATDGERRSYLDIADALRRFGGATRADLGQLWRRLVFNVLVSNTDDHLRNHAFLYDGEGGWRLSPAYDLNPVPLDVGPRLLSTAIGENTDDTSASLELAFEVAEYFDLEEEEARTIARGVAEVCMQWADRARAHGISGSEIDLMRSAFEHEDLDAALGR